MSFNFRRKMNEPFFYVEKEFEGEMSSLKESMHLDSETHYWKLGMGFVLGFWLCFFGISLFGPLILMSIFRKFFMVCDELRSNLSVDSILLELFLLGQESSKDSPIYLMSLKYEIVNNIGECLVVVDCEPKFWLKLFERINCIVDTKNQSTHIYFRDTVCI